MKYLLCAGQITGDIVIVRFSLDKFRERQHTAKRVQDLKASRPTVKKLT